MKRLFFCLFLILSTLLSSQDSLNKKRLNTILISGGTLYAGSIIMLNNAWYANQERTSFHWFNDQQVSEEFGDASAMPNMRPLLTPREVRDLVAYLATLRTAPTGGGSRRRCRWARASAGWAS